MRLYCSAETANKDIFARVLRVHRNVIALAIARLVKEKIERTILITIPKQNVRLHFRFGFIAVLSLQATQSARLALCKVKNKTVSEWFKQVKNFAGPPILPIIGSFLEFVNRTTPYGCDYALFSPFESFSLLEVTQLIHSWHERGRGKSPIRYKAFGHYATQIFKCDQVEV